MNDKKRALEFDIKKIDQTFLDNPFPTETHQTPTKRKDILFDSQLENYVTTKEDEKTVIFREYNFDDKGKRQKHPLRFKFVDSLQTKMDEDGNVKFKIRFVFTIYFFLH